MKTLLKKIIFLILVFTCVNVIATPHFSKVYFFGDSLTDVGNNKDNFPDQAPVTNKVITNEGKYIDGKVWANYFVEFMQHDGLLMATTNVIPSVNIDKASANDNIDFAYSGDPSGGYNGKNKTYHFKHLPNIVYNTYGPCPCKESNALCGMYNRIHNFAVKYPLDKNALYVIWVGANDIAHSPTLGWILTKKIISFELHPDDPEILKACDILGDNLSANIYASMQDLYDKGARNFLVINLPNVGHTPLASFLDSSYANFHAGKKDVVITMLSNITSHMNNKIAVMLTRFSKKHHKTTLYHPDINIMIKAMRNGSIAAFPPSSKIVNVNPVLAWDTTCCANEVLKMPNYNPTSCVPLRGYANICQQGSIELPNHKGYYAFFNFIHPSTCAHKYIARFLESFISGTHFDPSEMLCQN